MAMSKQWTPSIGLIARRISRPAADERGAALFIVLVTLVGLTALAAAGMINSETDLRSTQSMAANTRAFYAADAGLKQYMGVVKLPTDTVDYTIDGIGVQVTAVKLLDLPGERSVYRILSRAAFPLPNGGTATRVATLSALYSVGYINVQGAFTSPNGLLKNGGSGVISGADYSAAGDPECPDSPKSAVAGVKVPPSSYTQSGGTLVPDGDPPVDDSEAAEQLLAESEINWEAITDGLVVADYTIPPDSWPDFGSMGSDEWPLIYVDGNYAVTDAESGRGILVVRNNLQMNGDFAWDGAVLVGGYITSNGYQVIEGATMSGLSMLLGETVASSDVGNGNKVFKYHSCNVKKAATRAFGGFSEVPGTWSEKI